MPIRIGQQDPLWANVKLKNSTLTIKNHGCLIVSLCMGISKLNPRTEIRPNDLARLLKFTDANHPYGEGLLIWGDNAEQFKQFGIEFVGRYMTANEDDFDNIDRMSESGDHFAVIEVLTKTGGRHWLFVWKWGWMNKPVCFDPWDGKVTYNPYGFKGKYVRMTGYAVFRKLTA